VAELAVHGIKVSHVVPATVALAHSLPSSEGAHVHLELRPNDDEAIFLMNNRLVASVWIGEDDESAQAAQLRLWWQGLQRAGLATQATLSLRGTLGSHTDLAQKLTPYFQTVSVIPSLGSGDTGHVSTMALGSQLSLWSDLDALEITPEAIKQQRGNLQRRQRVVTVAAIIGLSVGFAVGLGNVAVAGLEDREARLNAEWRALSQDVKSEDTLRKERDALLKESEAWASVLEQRLDWPALFSYMNNAVPTGVRISEVRLEKGKSYQILGIADNTSLATQFVDQLRSSLSWGNARLDLTKTVEDGNTGQVSFVVGGTLIAKSTAPAK
jgi:Tfp pilus assembly protein PilN